MGQNANALSGAFNGHRHGETLIMPYCLAEWTQTTGNQAVCCFKVNEIAEGQEWTCHIMRQREEQSSYFFRVNL